MDRRTVIRNLVGTAVAMHSIGCNRDVPSESGSRQESNSRRKGDKAQVFCVKGGTPEQNVPVLMEMLGGIDPLIDPDAIVVIKVNSQWWNQGMTNTNALKSFIEMVLGRPGFSGEILVADNHQYDEPLSRGWTTETPNGDFNLVSLIDFFHEKGCKNVNRVLWRPTHPLPKRKPGRPEPPKEWFYRRIEGPWEGEGYVWRPDIEYVSPLERKCIMSYPVFTSTYSGTTVDLHKGAWKNGSYTGQPVFFVNTPTLNHHGPYVGVTGCVKNYMGVVDMSCGWPRGGPAGFFNAHFIGLRDYPDLYSAFERRLPWKVQQMVHPVVEQFYRDKYFRHTAGVLGTFMREIRKADLNLVTSDWMGFGSRIDVELSGKPKALIAGTDPVACDAWIAREILLPLTKSHPKGKPFIQLNDPDLKDRPFRKFLETAQDEIGGAIEREEIVAEVRNLA